MANTTISPNMSLPVPVVSTDPGPDWATNYNACLSILDQHNHSAGSGVQITQAGINLASTSAPFDSLGFNSTNAFALRSARFTPQGSPLALGTDLGCLYESGVDLYYNDGAGNQIRITQGGSVAGSSGTITGLPSGTASAAFSAGTFIWQSATNTAANMDAGSYVLRNSTANSKGLTLQPPNAMGANYALTLPPLPGATSFLTLGASGNISTLTMANINIPGTAVQEGGLNVMVSNTNATASLATIAGSAHMAIGGAWSVISGEGFSVSGTTSGATITFATPFATFNTVTLGILLPSGVHYFPSITAQDATAFSYIFQNGSATVTAVIDTQVNFIAVGQRA